MRCLRIVTACVSLCAACAAPRDQQAQSDSSTPGAASIAAEASSSDLASAAEAAEAMYYRTELDSARAAFQAILSRARASGDTAFEARGLTWLGLTAWKAGDFARARLLGEEALALKLRVGLRGDLFRSYNALGLLANDEGRLSDALALYQNAADAARVARDEMGLAAIASNQGLVYGKQGRFGDARTSFQRAVEVYRRRGDAMREGRVLNNLAMIDVQVGDPRSAIVPLERVRALFQSIGDRSSEQNALGQLGTAYDAIGEPSLALSLLDSALQLSRRHGLRQEEADNLEVIASLHRQAGDLVRSLELYSQANKINAELGQALEQGTNLRFSAEIRASLGRTDLARAEALEALKLHRAAEARLEELRDLLLLAGLPPRPDGSDVPLDYLRQAERIRDALDARVARVEVALASAAIADRAGDSRRVLRVLDRPDASRGGFGGEWESEALRARAYARLSRLDSAAIAGRAAVAAAERVRGRFGSAYLRSSFASDKANVYGDLVETLLRLNRQEEAFEVADGARSRTTLEHLTAVSTTLPPGGAVRTLSESEAMLRKIDTLVSHLDALDEIPPAERDAVAKRQFQALTTELAQTRGTYETLLVQAADRDAMETRLLGGRSIKASEVQRALGPDEAMLEYLVTPSRVVVFVVTPSSLRSIASSIPREDLTRRVRLARDLLGHRRVTAEARDVLTGLHEMLFAPVERAGLLRSVRRLVVVPHSVLAYLPFSALVQASTGRHVMEDYTLLILPSAAALGNLRPGLRSPDTEASLAGAALAPFPRALPGSSREARTFRRFYPRAHVTEGSRATEQNLRRVLASGGIVHVATHGVMNPRNPMFSRIEVAAGEGGKSDDDGRLEVHELLALRLDATLVFLSGCDTGLGSSWSTQFARGEDYTTLALAFLYAGARTVIATLWRIGDDGAAVLAERFYEKLRSLPPAEALVAAQRALLKDPQFSSPYYWAAYQVIGSNVLALVAHSDTAVSVQQQD